MSILLDILPTIVIPLAIGAFNYVSSWWYREAGHFEPDTCFELPLGPSWYISGLEVYQPYFQPVPMPSSSFPVREADERIRDLHMRSEMQAHSHRAMVNVPSPVCNKLSTAKMQPARSGFGLNHHLVSRLARESPQMGGGRQVPGPNPFLASTRQRISAPQYASMKRAVVYLPPPAVHSLPPPALPPPALPPPELPTWTPEILVPTVVEPVKPVEPMEPVEPVEPVQPLGVTVSHAPGSGRGFARKLCEIRKLAKIRRSRRLKFGGPPATPRRGAAMRQPLRDYTRGNQIRPDLLLTPSDIPYIGPLTSFWDAPMVAMGISSAPEVYSDVHHTSPLHHVRLRMSLAKIWIYLQSGLKLKHNTCLKWDGDCLTLKNPPVPMGMSSPNRENGWESPLAPSSDLPRQSISVEKLYSLWADPEEELYDPSCLTSDELEYLWGDSKGKPYDPSCLPDGEEKPYDPSCLPDGEETPYDPSCLPDGEFKNLWGDSEKELKYLWGGSDGSVGGSGESTPGIPETPPDNLLESEPLRFQRMG
ncbi:hypothetical protein BASA60_007275 [Batrachochytrium salamandrivorans]|nr:hypothetical protein BASA60_007275 [Batrachochytrium salamandrivorans]